MKRCLILSIALFATAPHIFAESGITAQSIIEDELDAFKLDTKCHGVYPLIESLPDRAKEMGLRKEDLIVAVESRLRSSNLYNSDRFRYHQGSVLANPYLYVHVNTVGQAFSVELELNKHVIDPMSMASNYAATWTIGTLGTHGNSPDYILSALRRLMDRFVNEWYKVNKPDGKCVE